MIKLIRDLVRCGFDNVPWAAVSGAVKANVTES